MDKLTSLSLNWVGSNSISSNFGNTTRSCTYENKSGDPNYRLYGASNAVRRLGIYCQTAAAVNAAPIARFTIRATPAIPGRAKFTVWLRVSTTGNPQLPAAFKKGNSITQLIKNNILPVQIQGGTTNISFQVNKGSHGTVTLTILPAQHPIYGRGTDEDLHRWGYSIHSNNTATITITR